MEFLSKKIFGIELRIILCGAIVLAFFFSVGIYIKVNNITRKSSVSKSNKKVQHMIKSADTGSAFKNILVSDDAGNLDVTAIDDLPFKIKTSGDIIGANAKLGGINLTNNVYKDTANATSSEICNNTSNEQALMIVGNSSGGGKRKVKMWDEVTVNGDLNTTGTSNSGTLNSGVKNTQLGQLNIWGGNRAINLDSHFNYNNTKENYISGKTIFRGDDNPLCINGTCISETDLSKLKKLATNYNSIKENIGYLGQRGGGKDRNYEGFNRYAGDLGPFFDAIYNIM
jgi:hypothetical protein